MRECQRAPAAVPSPALTLVLVDLVEVEVRTGQVDFDGDFGPDVEVKVVGEIVDIAIFQYTHCSRYLMSSGRSSGRVMVRVWDSWKP
jgi:hypothetical protein